MEGRTEFRGGVEVDGCDVSVEKDQRLGGDGEDAGGGEFVGGGLDGVETLKVKFINFPRKGLGFKSNIYFRN